MSTEPLLRAAPDLSYEIDTRDIRFLLWDQYRIDESALGVEPFSRLARKDIDTAMQTAWAEAAILRRFNAAMDRDEPSLVDDHARSSEILHELRRRQNENAFWRHPPQP